MDGAGEIRGGAGRRRGRGPVCRRAPPFPVLQGKLAPSPKEVFRSGQRRSPFDDACALGQKRPGAGSPLAGIDRPRLRHPERGDRLSASHAAGICQLFHPDPIHHGGNLGGGQTGRAWDFRLLCRIFAE